MDNEENSASNLADTVIDTDSSNHPMKLSIATQEASISDNSGANSPDGDVSNRTDSSSSLDSTRSSTEQIVRNATYHMLPSSPLGINKGYRMAVTKCIEHEILKKETQREAAAFDLSLASPLATVAALALGTGFNAAQAMVTDDFNSCFMTRTPQQWNWNLYLMPLWLCGMVIRMFLWVIRLSVFLFSAAIFVPSFMAVGLFPLKVAAKHVIQRKMIQMEARVINLTWFAVIKYHGVIPRRRPNQIFVCNHTTLIDFVLLESLMPFATVGQKQGGWIGFIQNRILACMEPLWFDRLVAKQRALLTTQLKERVSDDTKIPILVFPEGVCTNNTSTVQFKRGAFDVPDVEICPIAIKYNNLFCDAYWHVGETFWSYCCRIWYCWCVVVEISFLPPQTRQEGEAVEEFASRVQRLISDKAGLKFTTHNGYMKYFRPNQRFVEARQATLSRVLAELSDLN
ncbi:Acyltransferase [Carpediemonas membranifera]|uniref:Acyltransferase n=1 Tax=Carpediemonas membranifera TaxID=201153 RepID=A0A8J6AXT1_9EUKA|nr:Acyltransferase [Carpediemonas membranifera]|eukprot:KAG9394140.1 Acyltransferase [Carpediemonas membranifera]